MNSKLETNTEDNILDMFKTNSIEEISKLYKLSISEIKARIDREIQNEEEIYV